MLLNINMLPTIQVVIDLISILYYGHSSVQRQRGVTDEYIFHSLRPDYGFLASL